MKGHWSAAAVLILALGIGGAPPAFGQGQNMGPGGGGPMMGRDKERGQGMGMGPGIMGRGQGQGQGMGMGMGNMVRHRQVMMKGVPAPYRNHNNPLAGNQSGDPGNVRKGGLLYAEQCAVCHGPKGLGDGEGAKDLEMRPANIAATLRMPIASDGFLYWTVAEGGEALKSPMPGLKDSLTAEDIWKVILYLRAGFPAVN